jgi:hypothetical protein
MEASFVRNGMKSTGHIVPAKKIKQNREETQKAH